MLLDNNQIDHDDDYVKYQGLDGVAILDVILIGRMGSTPISSKSAKVILLGDDGNVYMYPRNSRISPIVLPFREPIRQIYYYEAMGDLLGLDVNSNVSAVHFRRDASVYKSTPITNIRCLPGYLATDNNETKNSRSSLES